MQEVNSVYDASFEDIKKFEKFMTYLQVKTWRLCRENKERIEKVDLINSEKSYTGAEIKYWFLMNNIDLESGSQYAGFWSFLNPCSKNLLIDNKFYYVSYNIERRQKCQIILDKTKL